jgi:hypothetical protein
MVTPADRIYLRTPEPRENYGRYQLSPEPYHCWVLPTSWTQCWSSETLCRILMLVGCHMSIRSVTTTGQRALDMKRGGQSYSGEHSHAHICCPALLAVGHTVDLIDLTLPFNVSTQQDKSKRESSTTVMARCKQTLRKKSPAKKLIGSEQVTLSNHDIMKKPAIRHSFESAPKYVHIPSCASVETPTNPPAA